MKKFLFALVLALAVVGCPTGPVDIGVPDAALRLPDATPSEAGHKVGGFSPTPTGTGLRKIVSGVESSAAATLVDADVNAAAAIAGSKISPNFGAQNVVTTGAVSIGATPATVGAVRLANNTIIYSRDSGNTADIQLVGLNASNLALFGVAGTNAQVTGTTIDMQAGGNYALLLNNFSLQSAAPIIGDTRNTAPYGVHGGVAKTVPSDANYTLLATEYCYDWIEMTLTAWTIDRTITVPAPASKAAGYYKTFKNMSGTRQMTISTGAGATLVIAINGVRRVWVDNGGVFAAYI